MSERKREEEKLSNLLSFTGWRSNPSRDFIDETAISTQHKMIYHLALLLTEEEVNFTLSVRGDYRLNAREIDETEIYPPRPDPQYVSPGSSEQA